MKNTFFRFLMMMVLSITVVFGIVQVHIPQQSENQSLSSQEAQSSQEIQTSQAEQSDYGGKLFDTSYVHEINIEFADSDWEELQENALSKQNYHANITIDGEMINDAAVSSKGSYSLRSIVNNSDSSRYSLKISFGKYVEQSFHGLAVLNLNNNASDASLMKDYISYTMFRDLGVNAPQASYVELKINGELQGLYLAVEDIDEAYLAQYHNGEGELYKPEARDIYQMNKETNEDILNQLQTGEPSKMSSDVIINRILNADPFSYGADLVYTDDDPASYTDIFKNPVTDISDEDQERLIGALKELSLGNVAEAVNTDEVIRYFAVHNFTNNVDSYTGYINHNYILYENNGKLEMLPWDYNYGTALFCEDILQEGYITAYKVDTDIDEPLTMPAESRPMWSFIINNNTYLKEYHRIYAEFMEQEFDSGRVYTELERVYNMITPYVKEDPTSLYTLEEYEEAYAQVVRFCHERSEAIEKQLAEK